MDWHDGRFVEAIWARSLKMSEQLRQLKKWDLHTDVNPNRRSPLVMETRDMCCFQGCSVSCQQSNFVIRFCYKFVRHFHTATDACFANLGQMLEFRCRMSSMYTSVLQCAFKEKHTEQVPQTITVP